MKQTESLRNRLESLTATYAGGTRIPVELVDDFSEIEATDENDAGAVIRVMTDAEVYYESGLKKSDQLRLIRNHLNHEVAHYNHSNLYGKEMFSRLYPNDRGLAGYIWNLVEDHYIDFKRIGRWPNMRDALALHVKLMMENDDKRTPINELESEPAQVLAGALQEHEAGYTKGVDDSVSDTVQTALARVRLLLGEVREADEQQERNDIAHAMTSMILEMLEDVISWDDILDLFEQPEPTENVPDDPEAEFRPPESSWQSLLASSEDETGDEYTVDRDADAIGEWYNARPDFETPNKRDEKKVYRIESDEDSSIGSLKDRIEKRDQRVRDASNKSESALDYLSKRGLDDEIAKAFRELTNQPEEQPDDRGSRMNMKGVNRHMSGDFAYKELYYDREIQTFGNTVLGVTVDMSGSMNRTKALAALLAVSIAAEETGDELIITGFGTGYADGVRLVTAPNESFQREHLNVLSGAGGTSTTHAVDDMIDLLGETQVGEKVMIVITDGGVNAWYGEDSAGKYDGQADELHEYVSAARTAGIKVIGMGVGSINQTLMQAQFSTGEGDPMDGERMDATDADGWILADDENLAETLVAEYERQILDDSDSVY